MAKNEKTSKRVAQLAAQILATENFREFVACEHGESQNAKTALKLGKKAWRDIQSVAASALTQTVDKLRK